MEVGDTVKFIKDSIVKDKTGIITDIHIDDSVNIIGEPTENVTVKFEDGTILETIASHLDKV